MQSQFNYPRLCCQELHQGKRQDDNQVYGWKEERGKERREGRKEGEREGKKGRNKRRKEGRKEARNIKEGGKEGKRKEGTSKAKAMPGSYSILKKIAGLQKCPEKTPQWGACKQSSDWSEQHPCLRTVGVEPQPGRRTVEMEEMGRRSGA